MKIPLTTRIHNKFYFEFVDSKTKKKTREAFAYNIVLDGLLSRLATGYLLPEQIAVGKGTGTLSTSRTALFDFLMSKDAVLHNSEIDNDTGLVTNTFKTVILSNELVGETLTEVGISASSTVFTHAMLEDSEGNPITIGPKLDTEEVTIYSTVYFTFADFNEPWITYCTRAGMTRPAYLVAMSETRDYSDFNWFVYRRMYLGRSKYERNPTDLWQCVWEPIETEYKNMTKTTPELGKQVWVADRVNSDEYNGEIREIGFVGEPLSTTDAAIDRHIYARIMVEKLPQEIWAGIQKTDVPIGTGDGENDAFNLNWSEPQNFVLKVDGVTKTLGADYVLRPLPKAYEWSGKNHEAYMLETSIADAWRLVHGPVSSMYSTVDWAEGVDLIWDMGQVKPWGLGKALLKWSTSTYKPQEVDILVSEDKATWETVASNKPYTTDLYNSQNICVFDFTNIYDGEYRYIKIVMKKATNDKAQILELSFETALDQIQLTNPPLLGALVTGDFKLTYIPKDDTNLLDIELVVQYSR